jgi:uncharacterized membrane protein YkoI
MTAKKHLSGLLKEYRITVETDTTTYIRNISPKNSTVPLSLDAKTGKLTKKKAKNISGLRSFMIFPHFQVMF